MEQTQIQCADPSVGLTSEQEIRAKRAVVGMMVLFQVCKPWNRFRKIIWCAMLASLVVVFTFLGQIFELRTGSIETKLVMFTLLLMTPTVFFAMQRLFDFGERIYNRWNEKGKMEN